MERLNVGDWVYYVGAEYDHLDGALGFIVDVERTCYLVEFTQTYNGDPIRTQKYVELDDVIPAEKPEETPMTEYSLQTLIDLALQTRDHEWFKELSEQYKRLKEKAGV
jgi:uncharacterized protein YpiB (UPF0302 family)